MFDSKTVKIEDNGIEKSFVISPLPALKSLKLLREIIALLSDTNLIRSVMLQQTIHNVFKTGVQVDGVNEQDYKMLMGIDNETLIANFVSSLLTNLTDEKLDILIQKCLSNVIYKNGSLDRKCYEAVENSEVVDFVTVIALLKEVLAINYGGAIDRLKKHLSLNKTEKI